MAIRIGKKEVGGDNPCFITFEAGPTFEGLDNAKQLIDLAAEAGADAVKFQIFDPDKLVADKKQPFSYDVLLDRETGKTETVTEPLYDILVRRCLSQDEWRQVKKHCDSHDLCFFATAAFDEDLELLEELKCDSVKIASADINHIPFIRKAAKTGMCIQIDTGKSTLGEIEVAVDAIRSEGNEKIIIHQCPSGYPAHLDSINLRIIQTLKKMFPEYPAAFSDHTPGWDMDIAAIAMGADLVEKTITLDRMTRSVEHIMSLEPHEMHRFIRAIRDLETAMGTSRRILLPEERDKQKAVRRSVYLAAPVKQGQKLRDAEVLFRRPGYGIAPDVYETLLDYEFTKDLPAEHQVSFADLQKIEEQECAA